MIIKNAIFDMDGTIVDTMEFWRNIQVDILHDMYSIKFTDNERVRLTYLSYNELLIDVAKKYSIDIDENSVSSESFRRMREVYFNGIVKFKPHAKEYLEYLKSTGCKIALATATTKDICVAFFEKIGILKYFDCIYTTPDDAKVDKSTSPAVYDMALEALGGTKEDTAIFEDSLFCMKTCKNNGYYVVAVEDKLQKPYEEEIRQLADKYIVSYKEMIN